VHDVRKASAAANARAGLLNHFECQRERHWPIAADPRFERFAFDQLHDVETLTVLFTIVSDTRDIGVTDLRRHPRFRARSASVPPGFCATLRSITLKRDGGIQHCVSRAISYRHCASAELDRKAVCADFHFKVIVLQRSGCQSSAGSRVCLVVGCRLKNQD